MLCRYNIQETRKHIHPRLLARDDGCIYPHIIIVIIIIIGVALRSLQCLHYIKYDPRSHMIGVLFLLLFFLNFISPRFFYLIFISPSLYLLPTYIIWACVCVCVCFICAGIQYAYTNIVSVVHILINVSIHLCRICLYLEYTSVQCRVRGYDRELGTACFLFRVVVEYTLDGFSLSALPLTYVYEPLPPRKPVFRQSYRSVCDV